MRVLPSFLLVVSTLVSISACKKACNTDDVPKYSLSAGTRAWSGPYPKDAVLRFRNANTGYVRSYRVSTAENENRDINFGTDVCPSYTVEYTLHELERTDSTGGRENKALKFNINATNTLALSKATISIGSSTFELPLQDAEDGKLTLSPATFAGRTYPAVLGANTVLAFSGPTATTSVYLTKADGLIRFEERGGTIWNRL